MKNCIVEYLPLFRLFSMYDSFLCMINARLGFMICLGYFILLFVTYRDLFAYHRISLFLCVLLEVKPCHYTQNITYLNVHLKHFPSKMLPAISINCCCLSKLKNSFKKDNLLQPALFSIDGTLFAFFQTHEITRAQKKYLLKVYI